MNILPGTNIVVTYTSSTGTSTTQIGPPLIIKSNK
jgi:hypothetical protein